MSYPTVSELYSRLYQYEGESLINGHKPIDVAWAESNDPEWMMAIAHRLLPRAESKPFLLIALDCMQAVEHLNPDPGVAECNAVTRKWLNREASNDELLAAQAKVWNATNTGNIALNHIAFDAWNIAWEAQRPNWAARYTAIYKGSEEAMDAGISVDCPAIIRKHIPFELIAKHLPANG